MNIARRIGGTALVVGLATLMGASVAMAAAGHSGTYGRHYMADNEDNPGVKCTYNDDLNFSGVKVDAPFLFAVNSTGGVDRQEVGWAFRVQMLTDGKNAGWVTIYTSSVQRTGASDSSIALFTRRHKSFSANQIDPSLNYRVQALMTWYDENGVSGRARHTFEWYHGGAFEPSFGPNGYCPGGIL